MPRVEPGPLADVVIIGAGQAGLATAYWLQRLAGDLSVTVLESGSGPGQSWRDRWDSLRLFTPRPFSQLAGMPMPAGVGACPTGVEMADYLGRYADRFQLDVRPGTTAASVTVDAGGFRVATSATTHTARQLVMATGPFREPALPGASADLSERVVQLHSSAYRRPADIPAGDVAIVGGGDSAAQLALELRSSHEVTLVTPRQPWFLPARVLGVSTYRWLAGLRVLGAGPDSLVARALRRRPDPVFGRELKQAVRAGRVRLLPHRVVGAAGDRLHLADGTRLTVRTVLWCTGFRPDYSWLAVPGALDDDGRPRHTRGASPVPGLHWMGLPWQARLDSSIVHGANADAKMTAQRISRLRS